MTEQRFLYKIVTQDEMDELYAHGEPLEFTGNHEDRTDGFIHLTEASEVIAEARLCFLSKGKDTLCMKIQVEKLDELKEQLRWDAFQGERDALGLPPRSGDRFPHLYAALPMRAVMSTMRMTDITDDRDWLVD
eukprot:TRINITY_DN12603_c0_g1_i3.p1 TRINITY_DN12603_c0_g1~~TRINITY_DN12603_c0_g1_i3.p1  ORF type:complete len:133 (+),score=34.35 TRINITY_DN12603_c0_g1_i3:132-530(+)